MNKKKINLRSGDILRIPLKPKLGYAYALYFDMKRLIQAEDYPDLIKVLDYKTEDKSFSKHLLAQANFLIHPLLVAGLRPALRKGSWEIVDHDDLEEFLVPEFKDFGPPGSDMKDAKEWFVIKEFKKREDTTFDEVKHLPLFAADGTEIIENKLTMYFLLRENKEINDFLDIESEEYNWLYKEIKVIPILTESSPQFQRYSKQLIEKNVDSLIIGSKEKTTSDQNNLRIVVTLEADQSSDKLLSLRHTLVETLEDRNLGKVWDESIEHNLIQVQMEIEGSSTHYEEVKSILTALGIARNIKIYYERLDF